MNQYRDLTRFIGMLIFFLKKLGEYTITLESHLSSLCPSQGDKISEPLRSQGDEIFEQAETEPKGNCSTVIGAIKKRCGGH